MDKGDTPIADSEFQTGPDPRRLSEPRSWEQIIHLYGGERTYPPVGRCGETHQFASFTEKLHFAGPPRKPRKRR